MSQVAKLFMYNGSQAVQLPAAYRFEGEEVYIRQDPENGDIILSHKPSTWDRFFEVLQKVDIPLDFLDKNDR